MKTLKMNHAASSLLRKQAQKFDWRNEGVESPRKCAQATQTHASSRVKYLASASQCMEGKQVQRFHTCAFLLRKALIFYFVAYRQKRFAFLIVDHSFNPQ